MIAEELEKIGREIAALNKRAQQIAVGAMVKVPGELHPFPVHELTFDLETGLVRVVFPFYGPDDMRLDRVEWVDEGRR